MSDTIKTQVAEKAERFGIKIDPKIFPDFGRTPAMVQLDPEEEPVNVRGDYYTLIDKHDGEGFQPITTVSERYVIVPHEVMLNAFFDRMESIVDVLGKPSHFELTLQQHGTAMFTKARFDQAAQIINGDKIFPELGLGNSVNTTKKLLAPTTVKRESCANGMRVLDSRFPNGNHSQRHIGEADSTDMVNDFLDEALKNIPLLADAITQWEGWNKVPISVGAYIEALEEIGFSETQIGKIFEQGLRGFKMYGSAAPTMEQQFAGRKDSNLWIAYNAVTQFITDNTENLSTEHNRSKRASEVFELLSR